VRIGLFGGTLNPIHFGHLRSAEEVREVMELDEVWFVPAALPPHKQSENILPFSDRLTMVELATAPVRHFKVSTIEKDRPGPSYSIDTLRELKEIHGGKTEFFFIIGSDAFLDIETWKEYLHLTDYASLVVMGRRQGDLERAREVISRAFPTYRVQDRRAIYSAPGKKAIHLNSVTHLAISATDIRRRVRTGLSVRFLVPEAVRRYMRENSLYVQPLKSEDKRNMPSELLVREIAAEVSANKGEELIVLDMRRRSPIADFFIIAQGRSTRHVQGTANNTRKNLRKKGIRCRGIEGEGKGKWILMDYGDIVVHLFYEPIRVLYDLEGLWSDVPRLTLDKEE
jgi:nicotinate-nucleotide adenylyltransferase